MARKKSSMTPFASKVKEVSRNAKMIASHIEGAASTVSRLAQFSQDLEVLSLELGLDSNERKALRQAKNNVEAKMSLVLKHLSEAQNLCVEISDDLQDSDDGYGPYLSREVTDPFTPIFSGKLSRQLIKLGRQDPSLRRHVREILKSIEED